MMRIRSFCESDIEWIAEQRAGMNSVHEEFDPLYYEPADGASAEFSSYLLKQSGSPDFCLLLAEEDGRRLGYCMGWVNTRPPIYKRRRVGYISHICVEGGSRGMGVGKALIRAMEDELRRQDVEFIEIHVAVENADAVRLVGRLGFRPAWCSHHKRAD
jgi:ribosomal protein S18 acetylase RimI-like enzyme